MKIILRSLFFLVVIIGMTSCGDDEPIGENSGTVPPANSEFKVDIDGNRYNAQASGVLTEDGTTQIVGKRYDGTLIKMVVSGSGTGSYTLSGTPSGEAFYYDGNEEEPYTMSEVDSIGNLTITEYDVVNGLASGTFNFMVQRSGANDTIPPAADSTGTAPAPSGTLKFENGEFTNIPLNTDIAPSPGEGNGDFQVKLDSNLYTAININASLTGDDGLVINTSRAAKRFNLQVTNPSQGSFDLADSDAVIIYNSDIDSGQDSIYSATEGTVNISEIDTQNHMVSGTFTGTLTSVESSNTIEMTEGIFENIVYSTDNDDNSSNYMNAKIGNDNFDADNVTTSNLTSGIVAITGASNAGDTLQIKVPYDVLTGSYSISTSDAFSGIYTKDGDDYTTVANSGTFTVDQREGSIITGSFTFSVRNSDGEIIQITQGEYKADIGI